MGHLVFLLTDGENNSVQTNWIFLICRGNGSWSSTSGAIDPLYISGPKLSATMLPMVFPSREANPVSSRFLDRRMSADDRQNNTIDPEGWFMVLRPSHVGSGSCIRDGQNACVLIEMYQGNGPPCWLIQLSNAITFRRVGHWWTSPFRLTGPFSELDLQPAGNRRFNTGIVIFSVFARVIDTDRIDLHLCLATNVCRLSE